MEYLLAEDNEKVKVIVIRIALTIMSLPRIMVVPIPPSLHTITDPFSGTDEEGECLNIDDLSSRLNLQLSDIRKEFTVFCEQATFHESLAAGPNGHAV